MKKRKELTFLIKHGTSQIVYKGFDTGRMMMDGKNKMIRVEITQSPSRGFQYDPSKPLFMWFNRANIYTGGAQ